MITLLIDVVSNNSIIALISQKESEIIGKIKLNSDQMHSENIVPSLESLISTSGYSYPDIKNIICITGPGNYTNIRTGVAVAKCISVVNDIDAYGLTQHELIADTYHYPNDSNTLTVITHSINNEFYYQAFEKNAPIQEDPIILSSDEILSSVTLSGNSLVETGNEFRNYLIRNNVSIKNLISNYLVPDKMLSKICTTSTLRQVNLSAKYIKTPKLIKYKKRDIYE